MITSRIDAVTHIPETHRKTVLPPPRSVKVELTAQCNYACSFCASSLRLREKGTMRQKDFERVARMTRDAGVEELGLFFLGESFMVPWLPDAIRYAKSVGFPYVFLTTNGSLANPSKVEACMNAGLNSLKWSYNYADAAQMEEITNVKERYWDVVNQNIRGAWWVREAGNHPCGLYASYIRYDDEQETKMEEAVKRIEPYVDEVYALPLYNQASYVTEQEKAMGWRPIPGNVGRADNPTEPLPCWAVFTEGHVTWDLKLGACCFSHDSRFDMADLNEVDFMTGWNSATFQKLREAHLKKDVTGTVCERCVIYE